MSYSLNSLQRGYTRGYIGTTIGGIKGDTRSLDYGSYAGSSSGPSLAEYFGADQPTSTRQQKRRDMEHQALNRTCLFFC